MIVPTIIYVSSMTIYMYVLLCVTINMSVHQSITFPFFLLCCDRFINIHSLFISSIMNGIVKMN